MTPGVVPLDVYHGDSHHWQLRLWQDAGATVPWDVTGATAKAEIRKEPGDPVLATLTCVITPPNTVDVDLTAAVSSLLPAGSAAWDLQLTMPGGLVYTVAAGPVTVVGDITDSAGITRRVHTRERVAGGRRR